MTNAELSLIKTLLNKEQCAGFKDLGYVSLSLSCSYKQCKSSTPLRELVNLQCVRVKGSSM